MFAGSIGLCRGAAAFRAWGAALVDLRVVVALSLLTEDGVVDGVVAAEAKVAAASAAVRRSRMVRAVLGMERLPGRMELGRERLQRVQTRPGRRNEFGSRRRPTRHRGRRARESGKTQAGETIPWAEADRNERR